MMDPSSTCFAEASGPPTAQAYQQEFDFGTEYHTLWLRKRVPRKPCNSKNPVWVPLVFVHALSSEGSHFNRTSGRTNQDLIRLLSATYPPEAHLSSILPRFLSSLGKYYSHPLSWFHRGSVRASAPKPCNDKL